MRRSAIRPYKRNVHILVVEDEQKMAKALQEGLEADDYSVRVAHTGEEGFYLAQAQTFDLMILDIMLPGHDGFEILATLRKRGVRTPVLLLTSRDTVEDRVRGLDTGADDYLVKPFAFDELRARISALSRRRFDEPSPVLSHGMLELDTALRLARVNKAVVALTPREYALLELLVRRKGRVMSRAAIFEQLYESQSAASDTVIEVLLSTLRAKLARAGLPHLIETRRGFGYVVD